MNSQVTLVTDYVDWQLRFAVHLREIDRTAFGDFCNIIRSQPDMIVAVLGVFRRRLDECERDSLELSRSAF